jgi:hypothetical protein
MSDLVERLNRIWREDHDRGCQGREYTCTCGFDENAFKTAKEAVDEIERLTVGQPISTAQPGQQMLAYEPGYGWLIVSKQMDGSFLQKSSGNFWMEVPVSVQFTHWLPYPGFLKEKAQ